MSIKTVKVSDKGQISLPQSVREQLGIERGDELVMFQIDDKIILEKQENVTSKFKDDFKDIMKIREKSLKKIWDNKEDDIWSEYIK